MSIASHKAQAIGLAAALACVAAFAGTDASAAEQVPFVGCASDGQSGPVAAPKGAPKSVALDAAAASQLAYYQAQDSFGVLAPRGWNCLYVYGSNGSSLMVSPSPLNNALDAHLSGAAVVATLDNGGTSGRYDVAKYSARLFAKQEQKFIAGVIAEGIEPKQNFPSGPYPADKLTYKTPLLVEFETPGNKDGLGTSDRLQKNAQAILGMATLKATPIGPDFFLLTVRLPANQAGLATAIVSQAE
jgi:protein involved in ribonucleotide reduction